MESESKVSLLPFFIGVTIIVISAVSYLHFLKSPSNKNSSSTKVLSAEIANIPPSTTPLPTPSTPILKSLNLSATDYPNTNLIAANTQITKISISSDKDCEQFDPANAVSPIQTTTYQNQPAFFQESQTIIDTRISTTRQYRLIKDSQCYIVTQNLQSINLNAPHDPKIKELDYDSIWQKLSLPLPN